MKRHAPFILAALLAAACTDPTATVSTETDITPNSAVVLPSCSGCAFGPVRYTRELGVRYEDFAFSANPAASWVLVVTDDGNAETGVEVILNGTQHVARTDLLGAGASERRIPVTLLGSNTILVRMHGPLGRSATVRIEPGAAATLTIGPNPVERLPRGTQQFAVSSGGAGPYAWSVNGVNGGNATFGTITSGGFYTAPAAVPTPATFQVCARRTADPAVRGCATVTINPIPTAGADVVVFNDVNVFDGTSMSNVNNQRMVRNLVTFTGAGPRSSGSAVVLEAGHGTRYERCFDTAAENEIEARGFTFTRMASATIGTQPANVKVLILCLPTVAYSVSEINAMKSFSAQGGRIIFVGEFDTFYGAAGLAVENQFLRDMGAVMRNVGNQLDCGHNVLPGASLRSHQITAGMTDVTIACASVVELGPNDFALFYDRTNTRVLAGVAKVDVTPLPAAAVARSSTASATRAAPSTAGLSNDPAGKHLRRR